jgi:hypothetical protein
VYTDNLFTFDELRRSLDEISEDRSRQLLSSLLHSMDADDLRELLVQVLSERPKEVLLKMCDVSNFRISQFGCLGKLAILLEQQNIK